MTSKRRCKPALTQSALASINEIEKFPIENWGKEVAERYIDDLEAGLLRIREQPELRISQSDFHSDFCFYRVNKHVFVCDRQKSSIIVLAVIHSAPDIPERLAELEPILAKEVEILHKPIRAGGRSGLLLHS